MAEDWRVTATLPEHGRTAELLQALHEHSGELGGRVAVSGDDPRVVLYADSELSARAAEREVHRLLAERNLAADTRVDRWHRAEERWEDASARDRAAGEHERLEQAETAESQQTGLADWEIRIELPSHHDAIELAERLEGEGLRVVRRWRFLLVGANDRDDADALAARLQREAPDGATLHVEPGSGLAWELMPQNPFAVFGGLGS